MTNGLMFSPANYLLAVQRTPIVAVKSATETITSDNTFTADADLTIALNDLEANSIYSFRLVMLTNSTVAAGIRFRVQCTSSNATFTATSDLDNAAGPVLALGGIQTVTGASVDRVAHVSGVFCTGTDMSGKTLYVDWAQTTSDASNTSVLKGSYLELVKIG